MSKEHVSIILIFRNQGALAEQILSKLYSHLTGNFSLYIIDNASADDCATTIQSVVEFYGHDQTYFLVQDAHTERRAILADVLTMSDSPFIWAPEIPEGITLEAFFNQDDFRNNLRSFARELREIEAFDPGSGLGVNPFKSRDAKPVPERTKKAPEKFNKYFVLSDEEEAPEPVIEDPAEVQAGISDPFGIPADDSPGEDFPESESPDSHEPGDTEHKTFAETSGRNPSEPESTRSTPATESVSGDPEISEPSLTDDDFTAALSSTLKQDEPEDVADSPPPVHKIDPAPARNLRKSVPLFEGLVSTKVLMEIQPRVEAFVTDGDYVLALKALDEAIERNPGETELVRANINLVERMRRYVEASELKHQLRRGGIGAAPAVVKNKGILVVDPSEDDGPAPAEDVQDKSTDTTPDAAIHSAGGGPAGDVAGNPDEGPPEAPKTGTDLVKNPEENNRNMGERSEQPESVANTVESPGDFGEEHKPGELSAEEDSDEMQTPLADTATPDESASDEKKTKHDDETFREGTQPGEHVAEEPSLSEEADSAEAASAPEESAFGFARNMQFDSKVRISIIIATSGSGRTLMERCFRMLADHVSLPDRELIVVNNGSVDDTGEFLDSCVRDGFMQLRVLDNPVNKGFAAAFNQGLAVSRGEFVLMLHNDVEFEQDIPGRLADLLDANPRLAAAGPVTRDTHNDAQRRGSAEGDPDSWIPAEYLDSFCMMIRRPHAALLDEGYELAWFEDLDLCESLRNDGEELGIATGLFAGHEAGTTTSRTGVYPGSRAYWKNLMRFREKWGLKPVLPDFGEDTDVVYKLVTISEIINPQFPEPHLLRAAQELLTSEVRTSLLRNRHQTVTLHALIRLMMVIDWRDVLRELESRLDPPTLDRELLYELVDFYYRKNIYSRCRLYLNALKPSELSFRFKLQELRILIGDKKLEEASAKVAELLQESPSHPELFRITAEIHNYLGNKSEAVRFFDLAHRGNPFAYNPRR